MNLNLLSKYRTECMGLAILFVLGVHSLDFGISYPDPIAKALGYGQIGVNIFFLLSGLGMYYSLKKETKGFYKKRAQKILPTYLLIAVPVFLVVDVLLDRDGLLIYFLDISTLRYWFQGIGYWYVAVQIILYLFIPFHHMLFQKAGKHGWTVNAMAVIIALFLGQILKDNSIRTIGTLFERFAVFIAGYWLAEAVEKGSKFHVIGGGVLLYYQFG